MLDSGGYFIPAGRAYSATQAQAAAQAAALREDALRAKFARNLNLWNVAQYAEQQGDVRVAARLYQRVALTRPRTEVTVSAQGRLGQIQSAAQAKLQALEDQLGALTGRGTVPAALQSTRVVDAEQVIKIFGELDQLGLEYAGATSIENRIKERVDQLRKQNQFAAILQEPTANELWKLGQKHEGGQQRCCAFLAYEQAANLSPAPSAEQARTRLKQMQADPAIVAEVRTCKNLQLCHEKYRRAMSLKTNLPERARAYLSEVIELAAPDTEVHKAARDLLVMLRS